MYVKHQQYLYLTEFTIQKGVFMAYRDDADLEFLGQLSDEELAPLVDILTKDKDGDSLLTEELTSSELYKQYAPQHSKYWKEIAAEIQLFGGNTLANIGRGIVGERATPLGATAAVLSSPASLILGGVMTASKVAKSLSIEQRQGVLYREVLVDVAEKLNVNFNKNSSVEHIEQNVLMKVFEDITKQMTTAQLQRLTQELKLPTTTFTPAAMTASFITIFKAGGFKSYQLSLIIANAIMLLLFNRGLAFGANTALTRTLGILSGPVGVSLTAALTLLNTASPAFRVTVPTVVCIAALRAEWSINTQQHD